MTDKVQKIREEVVRMHNLLPVVDSDNISVNYADRICTTLETYIDSLQEEPISEDLEEAAHEYADLRMSNYETAFYAFMSGAKWQRNSIWHEASEEPKEDVQILVVFNGKWTYVHFYHKHDKRFYNNGKPKFFLHEIDKWCYVSDILPTKD